MSFNKNILKSKLAFPGVTKEAQILESVIGEVYKVDARECIFSDGKDQIDWKLRSSFGASFLFSIFEFHGVLQVAIDFCFLRTPMPPTIEFRDWLAKENLKISLPCRLVLFQENDQSLVTINSCFPFGMIHKPFLKDLVEGMSGYCEMLSEKALQSFEVVPYYLPD